MQAALLSVRNMPARKPPGQNGPTKEHQPEFAKIGAIMATRLRMFARSEVIVADIRWSPIPRKVQNMARQMSYPSGIWN